MKKIVIGLMFLAGLSPMFAMAQTAPVNTDPVTKEYLLEQLVLLQTQLMQILTQHNTEQTALIKSLNTSCAAPTVAADAATSSVNSNLGSTTFVPPSTDNLNQLSGNPDGSDAAVAALRMEIENDNALHTMCKNPKNRAVNKTVDRLCVESGL
jgi:hypothetical protein